jgi:hypothetical protein
MILTQKNLSFLGLSYKCSLILPCIINYMQHFIVLPQFYRLDMVRHVSKKEYSVCSFVKTRNLLPTLSYYLGTFPFSTHATLPYINLNATFTTVRHSTSLFSSPPGPEPLPSQLPNHHFRLVCPS